MNGGIHVENNLRDSLYLSVLARFMCMIILHIPPSSVLFVQLSLIMLQSELFSKYHTRLNETKCNSLEMWWFTLGSSGAGEPDSDLPGGWNIRRGKKKKRIPGSLITLTEACVVTLRWVRISILFFSILCVLRHRKKTSWWLCCQQATVQAQSCESNLLKSPPGFIFGFARCQKNVSPAFPVLDFSLQNFCILKCF